MSTFKIPICTTELRCTHCNNTVIHRFLLFDDTLEKLRILLRDSVTDGVRYETITCKFCGNIIKIPVL